MKQVLSTTPAPAKIFSIRTFLLLLVLCATVLCPTSWQSLAHFQKISSALTVTSSVWNPAAPVTGSGVLSDDDWAWEGLADSGRQAALTKPCLTTGSVAARASEQDDKRFSWPDADTDAIVPLFLRADDGVPPLAVQLSSAPESGAIPLHLPAARGLVRFALPPPTFC